MAEKKKNLVVDLGNGVVKLKDSKGVCHTFLSTTKAAANDFDDIEGHHDLTMIVDNIEVKYLVGDADGDYCRNRRRYSTIDYKALLLTAIGVAFKNDKDNIFDLTLGVNLPITLYKDVKYIKQIRENCKGLHSFFVDGKKYVIKIEDIISLPENLIASTLSREDIMKKNLFIDIGSGTVDLLFCENGNLGNNVTDYCGIKDLEMDIAKKAGIQENQVHKYWDDMSDIVIGRQSRNVTRIKDTSVNRYVNNIISLAEKNNGGSIMDVSTVYVLGGGANIVGKEIEDMLEDTNRVVIVEGATFANLNCMETMFKQKMAIKKKKAKEAAKK